MYPIYVKLCENAKMLVFYLKISIIIIVRGQAFQTESVGRVRKTS